MEVTPAGKVARFTAFGFNKSGIALTTIKSSYGANNQYLYKRGNVGFMVDQRVFKSSYGFGYPLKQE